MTYANLKTEVKRNLGMTDTTDTELDNVVANAINYILTEVLPNEGYIPFLSSTTVTTTADTSTVNLPTDLRRIAYDGVRIKDGNDYFSLRPIDNEYEGDMDTGEPLYYQLKFSSTTPVLELRPIPDDEYTIQVTYYASPAELSNDTDVPDISSIYGDMPLIAGATWYTARLRGLYEIAAYWDNIFKNEKAALDKWQYHLKSGDIKTSINPYLE